MSNRKVLLNLLIAGLAILVIGGTITIIDDLRTTSFPVIDVRAFGAINDEVQVNGCAITAPSHTLTCTDPYGKGFTPSSVGKTIQVPLAGTSDGYGSPLVTTIATYVSTTSVTLKAAAINTPGVAINVVYGTDNGVSFCAATQCNNPIYTGIYGNGTLTGRELIVPGSGYLTTLPLYVRNGMHLRGTPTGTQVTLVGGAYKLTAPAAGIFDTPHVSPAICAGHNDGTGGCAPDLTSNGTTGETTISNVLASAPYVRTPGFLLTGQGGQAGAFSSSHTWAEAYYGIVLFHTNYTSIDHFTCDTGTTICLSVIGDGTDTSTSQWYGNQVTDSQIGLGQIGFWIDGTKDLLISNINFNFIFNHSESFPVDAIYFNSPEGYSSYRVSINHSNFLSNCQDHSLLSSCTQTYIEYNGPCIDCSVLTSTFEYSSQKDILLNSAATGTTNLLIGHNHFVKGQQSSGSSFSQANGSPFTGSVIFDTNIWDTPGNYAVFLADMDTKLYNNTCKNPFSVNGPVSSGTNDYSNGCFHFTGDSVYTIKAANNSVTNSGTPCGGNKCPVISIDGTAATVTGSTQGDVSDYATCYVCIYTAATFGSLNEVSKNYAASGQAAFSQTQMQGGLIDGGIPFANLGNPANGTYRYCSDCTVTTPATCTANSLASCVCASGGNGAFAKRLNGTWYCQ